MKKNRVVSRRRKRTVVAYACHCIPHSPDDCILKCTVGNVDLNTGAWSSAYNLNVVWEHN